jgi:hypothetical protein
MDDRIPEEYGYESSPASTPDQSHRFAGDHDRMSIGSTGTFIGHPDDDSRRNEERRSASHGDVDTRPRRRARRGEGDTSADIAGVEVSDRYARDHQTPEAWFA